MAVTIVRTTTSSQLGSLLTQASASTNYLTQASASTNYLTQDSASTTYLTQASASTNYLTQASASTTYLTQASASTNYLTQASASSTYAPIIPTTQTGFRNAIINGDFGINQRNFTSLTTDGAYGFDRWLSYASSGGTYSAQTFTPGAAPVSGYEGKNFYRIVTTGQSGAGVYTSFEQRIEDVRTFAGQTVTLSFWAKAASGTPKVSIEFIQNFGTGGSATVLTNASAITLSTSWARYSVSVAIPSISSKTIGTSPYLSCVFWISAGTTFAARTNSIGIQSNTFDFWGVQVERGAVATPFEQRPIGIELALCQRYYQNIVTPNSTTDFNGLMVRESTTVAQASVYLPVSMRVIPALVGSYLGRCVFRDTSFNVATGANSTISISSSGPSLNWITLIITHAAVAGSYVYAEWDLLNTTTNLALNAEL